LRAQGTGRAHGRPFIIGGDGEKILDPHDFGAGQIFDRALIDGDQLGADRRRPDHARMHHVRQTEILHVSETARAFGGHVRARQRLANQRIARWIFERRFRIELEIEALDANELGESNSSATVFGPHLAVGGNKIVGADVKALRRKRDQRRAGGGRSAP